jgi:hypothetical protein
MDRAIPNKISFAVEVIFLSSQISKMSIVINTVSPTKAERWFIKITPAPNIPKSKILFLPSKATIAHKALKKISMARKLGISPHRR